MARLGGLADSTIRNDTGHLQLIRDWFGRPLWEMQPDEADAYFGRVLRDARPSTRTGQAAALRAPVPLARVLFTLAVAVLGGFALIWGHRRREMSVGVR